MANPSSTVKVISVPLLNNVAWLLSVKLEGLKIDVEIFASCPVPMIYGCDAAKLTVTV